MSQPLVSAIIVNWNGGTMLQEAITSLLAQTWTALEVIVVDNASSDGSADAAADIERESWCQALEVPSERCLDVEPLLPTSRLQTAQPLFVVLAPCGRTWFVGAHAVVADATGLYLKMGVDRERRGSGRLGTGRARIARVERIGWTREKTPQDARRSHRQDQRIPPGYPPLVRGRRPRAAQCYGHRRGG
jgi:glycosyltransferase involved in cell wall biosynthesis